MSVIITRKSFDISEADLSRARRQAQTRGKSLNAFLLDAVVETLDDISGVDRMVRLRDETMDLLNATKKESLLTRKALMDANELALKMFEQRADEMIEKITTINKAFIVAINDQLNGAKGTPITRPQQQDAPSSGMVFPKSSMK